VEVVASLSQGRTAAAQCGLFTYKSVPVIFEPPFIKKLIPVLYLYLSFVFRYFRNGMAKSDSYFCHILPPVHSAVCPSS